VPAGTKVLLSIKSAVNTKTARPGDSVYLESTFPVVVDGHVLIPPGVYVQGVLDRVVRPGRVKGRAEVAMHFTSMIFPNGNAIEIPGVVNSLPGSANAKVKDPEGTIQQGSSAGKDAGNIAKAAGAGAGVGSIGGAATGHPLAGAGYGALGGALAGGLYTLFTRGDEVAIPQGTVIEMVLQRPLQLEEQTFGPAYGPPNPYPPQRTMGPQPGQQQPMAKPAKQQLVCPPGDLGCGT
jgi:type IV secretion system protein VirB10